MKKKKLFITLLFFYLFLFFVTETISRTDEGQPRPKYIYNKCGTNIYFFTLQMFGPSPSPKFRTVILDCSVLKLQKFSLNRKGSCPRAFAWDKM